MKDGKQLSKQLLTHTNLTLSVIDSSERENLKQTAFETQITIFFVKTETNLKTWKWSLLALVVTRNHRCQQEAPLILSDCVSQLQSADTELAGH